MTGSSTHPASHSAAPEAAGRTYAFSYRVWRFS
jgi:hypothetical protein